MNFPWDRKSGRKGNSGFSLIEVIITIVIFSIAVGGVMAAFGTVLAPRNAPLPVEITQGTFLTQEKMESILADRRLRGFAYIQQTNYPPESKPGDVLITTRVEPWPGNPDFDHYRQVTVRVTRNGQMVGQAATLVVDY